VLLFNGHRRELSGGFRKTTNNRMELMACIAALDALKKPCRVTLYSDSRYVVDGMEKGRAGRWQKNGWMRNREAPAKNADLWARLLALCEVHAVRFRWVKGHADNKENERCDRLANAAAQGARLMRDENYESGDMRPEANPL
jgi:ribonuclease HI